jgi:hypothetical protein
MVKERSKSCVNGRVRGGSEGQGAQAQEKFEETSFKQAIVLLFNALT